MLQSNQEKPKDASQCPGRFWVTIDRDPTVSKSSPLRVEIFRFFLIKWRYRLKRISNFPEVLNFNRLFLPLLPTDSSVTRQPVHLVHWCQHVTKWTWKTRGYRPNMPKNLPGHWWDFCLLWNCCFLCIRHHCYVHHSLQCKFRSGNEVSRILHLSFERLFTVNVYVYVNLTQNSFGFSNRHLIPRVVADTLTACHDS